MQIDLAHVRARASSGGWVDYAVFAASSTVGDNAGLLADLTFRARAAGLKVDQSALAYRQGGQIQFYGTQTLVAHLVNVGLPQWTHKIDA